MNSEKDKNEKKVRSWISRVVNAVKTATLLESNNNPLDNCGFGRFDCVLNKYSMVLMYGKIQNKKILNYSIHTLLDADINKIIEDNIFAFLNDKGEYKFQSYFEHPEDAHLSHIVMGDGKNDLLVNWGKRDETYYGYCIFQLDKLDSVDPEKWVADNIIFNKIKRSLLKGSIFNDKNSHDPFTLLNDLKERFSYLISKSKEEEEIQEFIKKNPILLYPSFENYWPKFQLGKEWVTDFVFENIGYLGKEYVFVEIEKSNKKIFTQKGQFSHEYTQAKDQILNWMEWIDDNRSYLKNDFPDLVQPVYHLIMGRSNDEFSHYKTKILKDSVGFMRFSTFDDVYLSFSQTIKRFEEVKQTELTIGQ